MVVGTSCRTGRTRQPHTLRRSGISQVQGHATYVVCGGPMSKLLWKPWHEAVKIRDDLRSGELSLAMFAADLYDVAMRKGLRPVYEEPEQFFALTYPTL